MSIKQQAVEYYDSTGKHKLSDYYKNKQMKIYTNDKLMRILEGKSEPQARVSIFSVTKSIPFETEESTSVRYSVLPTDTSKFNSLTEESMLSIKLDLLTIYQSNCNKISKRIKQSEEIQLRFLKTIQATTGNLELDKKS